MNIQSNRRMPLAIFLACLILIPLSFVQCQERSKAKNGAAIERVIAFSGEAENRERLLTFAAEIRILFAEKQQFGGRLFFENKSDEADLSGQSQDLLAELHSIFGNILIEIEVERLKESKPVWIRSQRLGYLLVLDEEYFSGSSFESIIWHQGEVGVFDYR
jgi:hypothetical protein